MGDPFQFVYMTAERMYAGVAYFPLLAIPLFILAGNLMNVGGITERLFLFSQCLVGHIKGGLGHVNVLASMIFAGMSSSAMADAVSLGLVEIDAICKAGYDLRFSAAVTAAEAGRRPSTRSARCSRLKSPRWAAVCSWWFDARTPTRVKSLSPRDWCRTGRGLPQ